MVKNAMVTVHFEDHGQDFLEWDIYKGIVVNCRPFQATFWVGTKVSSTNIIPGSVLDITPKSGTRTRLRYPAKKIIKDNEMVFEDTERAVIPENPKHLKCSHCGHEEDIYAVCAIPEGNGHYTLYFGSDADFCTICDKPWGRNSEVAHAT